MRRSRESCRDWGVRPEGGNCWCPDLTQRKPSARAAADRHHDARGAAAIVDPTGADHAAPVEGRGRTASGPRRSSQFHPAAPKCRSGRLRPCSVPIWRESNSPEASRNKRASGASRATTTKGKTAPYRPLQEIAPAGSPQLHHGRWRKCLFVMMNQHRNVNSLFTRSPRPFHPNQL
jgi:hypothetical protein